MTGRPPDARRLVFDLLQVLSHPGVQATQRLVGDQFMWFSMQKDIASWCKSCHSCKANKIHKHHHSPVQVIPVPEEPFSHVHMDLVGPFTPSNGFMSIFTDMAFDRHTRWPEAILMTSTMAESCTQAFLFHWVAWFGVPCHLTSDRGPQIHLFYLGHGSHPRDLPPPNIILPSAKQQGGGAHAPQPQVLIEGVLVFPVVDGAAPVGSPGPPGECMLRLQLLSSQPGLPPLAPPAQGAALAPARNLALHHPHQPSLPYHSTF